MKINKIVFSIQAFEFFETHKKEEVEAVFYKAFGIKIDYLFVILYFVLFVPIFFVVSYIIDDIEMSVFSRVSFKIITCTVFFLLGYLVLLNTVIRYKLEQSMHTKDNDFKS